MSPQAGPREPVSEYVYAVDNEAREALGILDGNLAALATDLAAERGERIEQADQIRTAARDTGQDLAALARAARRLAARVQWLEERLRACGGIPVMNLETTDPELLDLAALVLNGRQAEESLLDPAGIESLRLAVSTFTRLEQERDQAMKEVLAISAALESSARTDPARAHQTALFDEAEQRLAFATGAVAENARFARAARKRLLRDDERRAGLAPAIDSGAEAQAALESALRHHLVREVSRGALPPPWFSADLGPGPATIASRRPWLDIAASALTHRIVYAVDDTRSILGPPPAGTGHRAQDHARLYTGLTTLDESA